MWEVWGGKQNNLVLQWKTLVSWDWCDECPSNKRITYPLSAAGGRLATKTSTSEKKQFDSSSHSRYHNFLT